MGGVHLLQRPSSLQAHSLPQYSDVKVVTSRNEIIHPKYSNAKYEGSSFEVSGSVSQLDYGVKCRGRSIWCVGFQHSSAGRKADSRRSHFGGFRKINVNREGIFSVSRTRCKSSDRESVSTTTTADSEEQQIVGTSESNQSDDSTKTAATESGLSALDAYFNKLNGSSAGGNQASKAIAGVTSFSPASTTSVRTLSEETEKDSRQVVPSAVSSKTDGGKELQGLKSLDAYFEKLKPKPPEPLKEEVEKLPEKPEESEQPEKAVELTEEELFLKALLEAKEEYEKYKASQKSTESKSEGSGSEEEGNELDLSDWEQEAQPTASSDLINLLVAVNVAVYLFGLASPHEAFGITDASLPFVYGAKVNELIIAGQWWRLITPMFLHASFLHVALGSWALLSFGPAVESAYGTYGFAMIYFLGGIFGNLMSFFHTNEWTVGGSGPIYALVGTWLVYLLKNRDTIGKEIADDMIRKVIILSALNVALWNSLPVDDWTHLGAVVIGLFFGLLASPTMQFNLSLKEVDPESKEEVGEAFLWFNEGLSPARLTLVFIMCLGIFYVLYQLAITGSSDFYLLQDKDIFS
ncbi:hypothetical protein R1sor_017830 [Riccia sorocarpa]|uniref:Peptidase S54 rhomboid domain-containing protein n=1 Tax=Riccia sorocarpa TaxID=122646 RepID=A0ABD3I7Y2_9MARC